MNIARILSVLIVWCVSGSLMGQEVATIVNILQRGGINEANPNFTSFNLRYQKCTASNAEMQTLFKLDVIGTGTNKVPLGSTITSATMRLQASSGGDGILYRCGEVWDSSPTWNELGDVSTIGSFIGVGMNTGQTINIDVKSHIQAMADGQSNQGWVIKGLLNDCQAAEVSATWIRVTVVYTPPDPPDTTRPQVTDVDVRGTNSTHASYDVPDGSGTQIRTIPIGKPNQFLVKFSEDVNVSASHFLIRSGITSATYPLASSGGFTYNSSSFLATLILQGEMVNPDQIILTVSSSVDDDAGNNLNGKWTNPTNVNDTGTSQFPSGTGTTSQFEFYLTVLPAGFDHDNDVDGDDFLIWQAGFGTNSGAKHRDGDGDGDGDVDGDDFLIWQNQFGVDYTSWASSSQMSGGGGTTNMQSTLQGVLEEFGIETGDANSVESYFDSISDQTVAALRTAIAGIGG